MFPRNSDQLIQIIYFNLVKENKNGAQSNFFSLIIKNEFNESNFLQVRQNPAFIQMNIALKYKKLRVFSFSFNQYFQGRSEHFVPRNSDTLIQIIQFSLVE